MSQDTRDQVKVGDYFNLTRAASGNEVWDNQNRFDTCQLLDILPGGSWVFNTLWYEYSYGDYPFLPGSPTTWNLQGREDILIERITDPETEGFKDKKKFLPEKIKKKVQELRGRYDDIRKRIIIETLKEKKISDNFDEQLSDLDEISRRLGAHEDYRADYQHFGFIDALREGWVFSPVTVEFNGKKMVGEVSRIIPPTDSVEVSIGGDYYEYPLCAILPNDELYPIDFAYEKPWSCVFGNSECESLAMRILRLTESWDKPLTWEEYYKTLSPMDLQVASLVERDFVKVSPYLVSPERCAEFSNTWREIYEKHQIEKTK